MSRIIESILPESIRNEGLLFVPQVLEDLMRGKLDREFPARLGEGEDPASARTYAFDVARRLYKTFADSLSQANYKVVTRKFVVNLLDNVLGWRFDRDAAIIDTDSPFLVTPIGEDALKGDGRGTGVPPVPAETGRHGQDARATQLAFPVVVCPHKAELDQSLPMFHGWGLSDSGRSATRFAQEFLNARDEYLWALVTNGKELRLVRDNPSLTRPSFLSFDLSAILGGAGDFPAFAFLWRMLHGSRVDVRRGTGVPPVQWEHEHGQDARATREDLSAEHSLWEALHTRSSETGVQALTGLRSGVVTAIEVLGTGFLKLNPELREALQNGSFSAQAYEQELLHLAYRFLFLFIAEERRLLHTPGTSDAVKKIYREGYSMARLRHIAARYAAGSSDRHTDLYEGVRIVFAGLAHGEARLGLTALGGIFSELQCVHLNTARLANADLIAAMRALRYIDAGKKLFPVNYRDMGSEEFGSVYEGILELVPNYTAATQTFSLVGAAGNNRKTTGSYYTPSSLVEKQVESALVPLIDRCARAPEPERALLGLRVIDTSCGSGHFTVAAARRLATALVEVRGGDSSPEAYQRALRDVVCNAIYGVDINPLAVELAKITLWIESVVPGQPLSFLDAHFVCGDATLGIDNIKNLENGIPAAAYKQLPGDDKEAAQEFGKKNRTELKVLEKERKAGQLHLPTNTGDLSAEIAKIAALPETTLAEVEAKKAAYEQYLSGAAANRLVKAANLFIAAFLLPKTHVRGTGVPPVLSAENGHGQDARATDATPSGTGVPPVPITKTYPSARTDVSKHYFSRLAQTSAHERNLPHWGQDHALIFITFRLADSLPREKLDAWRNEREQWLECHPQPWDDKTKKEYEADFGKRLDQWLDSGHGSCILTRPKCRKIVVDALEYFNERHGQDARATDAAPCGTGVPPVLSAENRHGQDARATDAAPSGTGVPPVQPRYNLHAYAVASNHVHVVMELFSRGDLPKILHSWKSFSAKAINKVLGRDGVVWQDEYYDHLIRDAENYENTVRYVERHGQDARATNATPSGTGVSPVPYLPLYEAKMIHQFDHRWTTYEPGESDVRDVTLAEKQNPDYEPRPRYWVERGFVEEKFLPAALTQRTQSAQRDAKGETALPPLPPRLARCNKCDCCEDGYCGGDSMYGSWSHHAPLVHFQRGIS